MTARPRRCLGAWDSTLLIAESKSGAPTGSSAYNLTLAPKAQILSGGIFRDPDASLVGFAGKPREAQTAQAFNE